MLYTPHFALCPCTCTDEYVLADLVGGLAGHFSVGRHRAKREDLVLVRTRAHECAHTPYIHHIILSACLGCVHSRACGHRAKREDLALVRTWALSKIMHALVRTSACFLQGPGAGVWHLASRATPPPPSLSFSHAHLARAPQTNVRGRKLQCSHFTPLDVQGVDGRLPCVVYW